MFRDDRINSNSKRILRTKCHYVLSRDVTCLTVITTVSRILFPLYVQFIERREEDAVHRRRINIQLLRFIFDKSISGTWMYYMTYTFFRNSIYTSFLGDVYLDFDRISLNWKCWNITTFAGRNKRVKVQSQESCMGKNAAENNYARREKGRISSREIEGGQP